MPLHIQHFHRLVQIFIRLPFGVKCALEIFQRTMDRMVEDLDGVVFMDDEIVAGDETMHDKQRRCETPLPLLATSSTSTSMAELLL